MFPTLIVVMRSNRGIAERRANILKVMAHNGLAVFLHDSIDRISGFHVREIRPCAENLERSQFPAMLVWNEIVRIIRTRTEILEPAKNFSGQELARGGAVKSIRVSLGTAQYIIQVALSHP